MVLAITHLSLQGKIGQDAIIIMWSFRGAMATLSVIFGCRGIIENQYRRIAILSLVITLLAISLEFILLASTLLSLIGGFLKWLSQIIIRW
ncbi:hypothetical protein [Pseudanabaena sp. 'Roaring Creek']|uniref:hypothetical protein n=1 Tax=Pseudanabaena sp. 'Roaring Creek' TaxID=1681830 RepID=UPI0006D7EA96|nr:hypothetical protein [Pseudanabaena sp. 'Roaring Creek']